MLQAYPAVTLVALSLISIALQGCSGTSSASSFTTTGAHPQKTSDGIQLSTAARHKIGNKIWQNESGRSVSGLTHWNDGEEFPSMGIGHFIWYPRDFRGPWTESFPLFVSYARRYGDQALPSWILESRHCPWPDKASFTRDFNGPRLTSLRHWLANHIALQTDFIIQTSRQALPNIMSSAPVHQRNRIQSNYQKVASTANGVYALIDYVNFKGDGTNPTEQYNGEGWGLMWVLMDMGPVSHGPAAAAEFAAAAKRCLDRRIKNSPPSRGEKRWRAGWHNRCNTYAMPL